MEGESITLKRPTLVILFGIILILATYLIVISVSIPYIGVSVQIDDVGRWKISDLDPLGWAKKQELQIGDIITEVNQNPPAQYPTLLQYGVIEKANQIGVIRNGSSVLLLVTQTLYPNLILYHTVIPAIVFTILLAFSIFLYIKKGNDKNAILLIAFFLDVGFSYLSAGGASRIDNVAVFINRVSFLFIPTLFLEFTYSYFGFYGIRLFKRKIIYTIYFINILLIITHIILINASKNLSILRHSFLMMFSLSIVMSLYILFVRYLEFRRTIHKPIFKIMIFGLVLSFFPFVGLVGLPRILFGMEIIPGSLAAVFLLFLPAVFLYLITANHLFDIDFVVSRIRYYSILACLPAFTFTMFSIHIIDKELLWIQRTQIFLLAYTGTIIFLYAKEELDYRFRSRLFREKFNFQASLDRFSNNIGKVMKVIDLEDQFITEIKEVLSTESVSLLEFDRNHSSFHVKNGTSKVPYTLISEILQYQLNSSNSIGQLFEVKIGSFVIVNIKEEKFVLLWIGDKADRTRLNQDEKIWIKTIAQYVGLVYENLYFIEGLIVELEKSIHERNSAPSWGVRFLFNLSEKERRRLAADLHDSVLQDQLLWYRKLENITTDKRIPLDLQQELLNVSEGLLDVVHQIRETCSELRPPFLKEMGIVRALENLFEKTQLRANFFIHFNANNFSANLEFDHAISIYRIIQELLTNAVKHSKAGNLFINLESNNKFVRLHYQDDGVGMDFQLSQASFNQMGLSGIKERVYSHKGEISFHSHLNKGFEVSIAIPIQSDDDQIEERGR